MRNPQDFHAWILWVIAWCILTLVLVIISTVPKSYGKEVTVTIRTEKMPSPYIKGFRFYYSIKDRFNMYQTRTANIDMFSFKETMTPGDRLEGYLVAFADGVQSEKSRSLSVVYRNRKSFLPAVLGLLLFESMPKAEYPLWFPILYGGSNG